MPYRYSALTADCFFENKPQALPVHAGVARWLELFFEGHYTAFASTMFSYAQQNGRICKLISPVLVSNFAQFAEQSRLFCTGKAISLASVSRSYHLYVSSEKELIIRIRNLRKLPGGFRKH